MGEAVRLLATGSAVDRRGWLFSLLQGHSQIFLGIRIEINFVPKIG